MKHFLELPDYDWHALVCRAVAAVEGVDWTDVFVRNLSYSISASEGVRSDVCVTTAFRSSRLVEGDYTMRWDGNKEQFVQVRILRRKLKDHTSVTDSRFVFNPWYQQVEPDYIDFAIAHVMREMGYRRHTCRFFVKSKGEQPKLVDKSCRDYNGYSRYVPGMGWLEPYGDEGYICAAPSHDDIIRFCKRFGIEPPFRSKKYILDELIKAYRRRSGFADAFRRYSHEI